MEFKEGHSVGIDLGTTFSCIAHLDQQGNPVPVANDNDEIETPSLIVLGEQGNVIVGPPRSRAAMENPEHVIERIKRFMGTQEFKRTIDGQEITPEFLSALILKKVCQDAAQRIGPIGNAVITVPAYFNDSRRKSTQDAGKIAGVNVIDIVNEPTAATLTYAWHRGELGKNAAERARKVLVYDLGGGTFDVTVVRYLPTHFQVLATDGDVHLGGVDWNDKLFDYVADEFKARHGAELRESAKASQQLRNNADLAKIALSKETQTSITARHAGKAVSVPITREQFEDMTALLLQRTLDTTEQVLDQAELTARDLDAIVLVGGSTLMPAVARKLEETTGVKPDMGLSPHTSVAQGAAIHAAILDARHRGDKSEFAGSVRKYLSAIKQDDVNSHGLGIAARNPKSGRMINHVMIPRNTRLPVEVRQTFRTNVANQERVNVQVIEGDAPDPAACSLLGNCRIFDLPANLPEGAPIEVTYAFDASGRIKVRARDGTGGGEAAIEITRRGGLSDAQIDAYTKLAAEYRVE